MKPKRVIKYFSPLLALPVVLALGLSSCNDSGEEAGKEKTGGSESGATAKAPDPATGGGTPEPPAPTPAPAPTPEPAPAPEPVATSGEPLKIAYSDWPGWVAWEIALKKDWFNEAGVNFRLG